MHHRRRPWPLLAAPALLFSMLLGCASWQVHTDLSGSVDVRRFRTYAWLTPPPGSAEEELDYTATGPRIRREVARDLGAKGIFPVTVGSRSPDFLAAYRVFRRDKLSPDWGYGADPVMGRPDLYRYTEGTLVIDFVDPATGTVFWRGAASKILDEPEVSSPDLEPAIQKMLAQYPPAPRG